MRARKKKGFNLTSHITQHLRAISRFWPPKAESLKNAKQSDGKFKCGHCNASKDRKEVQVDHKVPVGGFQGDWNLYIEKLFCDVSNLEVLCLACHQQKTNKEREERRKYKEATIL